MAALLVCPGYTSHSGSAHDDRGFFFISGASFEYHQSKKVMQKWLGKSSDERYDWWTKALKELGYTPARVSNRIRASPLGKPDNI